MRADGAAVVHLSPHARGEPESASTTRPGSRRWSAALVGLGHRGSRSSPGRRRCSWRASGSTGTAAASPTRASPFDERLVVRTAFDRDGGALGVDTLLAGDAPFTAICLRQRPARARRAGSAWRRSAIDVPDDVSVAGFDDISVAAMTAPSLSTVRLPLREMGRRGFAHAERVLAGDAPDPARLPTELVAARVHGRRHRRQRRIVPAGGVGGAPA